jgi:hypothetical protein
MNEMINCKVCQSHLPDLLLDEEFAAANPEIALHLHTCDSCRTELEEIRATYELLDEWRVPEPSPYFDSRLYARLREVEAAQPESLLERLHAFLLFSTGRQLRPALAGVLMLMLLIGGGIFAELYRAGHGNGQPAASATVNDLRILDNNDQALQQMDQLLDTGDDSSDPPTT